MTDFKNPPEDGHVPVMLEEALHALNLKSGGVYIDATFGGGGYSKAILERTNGVVWAIDRDSDAVARGKILEKNYPTMDKKLHVLESTFSTLVQVLDPQGVKEVDGIVFDLGVSSYQLDNPERGFSFRSAGPLDMRMSSAGMTAGDVVNTYSEKDIADIVYQYGEEPRSRAIAKAIVTRRLQTPFQTTEDLADLVRHIVPVNKKGHDPSTRTFQALRMYVNQEIQEIRAGLHAAAHLLRPGGRLVVVAFHSLEDREIKEFLRPPKQTFSRHHPGFLTVTEPIKIFNCISNRVIHASSAEISKNPRSRSARLRVAERTTAPWGMDDHA